jgi:hypothetical protein
VAGRRRPLRRLAITPLVLRTWGLRRVKLSVAGLNWVPRNEETWRSTLRPLCQWGKTPATHLIGGWVDPKAGLDPVATRKIPCPFQESNPGRPESSPVAIAAAQVEGYSFCRWDLQSVGYSRRFLQWRGWNPGICDAAVKLAILIWR